MARINLVDDIGAPALVVVADIVTEQQFPKYNEYASYALAAGGYVGAYMGKGGDFVKNVGIASFPWAARHLYNRVKGMGTKKVTSVSRVGRIAAYTDPNATIQLA